MTPSRLFLTLIAPALLFSLSLSPALAQEANPIEAVSREDAAEASAEANKAEEPGDAAASGETNGTAEPTAETTTPGLDLPTGDAAIAEADAIAAFDAEQVRGIAQPWQLYYQTPASPTMEHLVALHDAIQILITVITVIVMALILYVCVRFRAKRNPSPKRFAHNTLVEIIWTAVPILILIGICIPSLRAHYQYTNNENIINNPDLTLKVTGNQWYWNYEYPDYGIKYDSNIVKDADLKEGEPRLLMVDNPVVVPVGKVVRVQMTSADVIHDWAVPAFGVKQDTVPGKLNESWFKADQEGIYFGQCSELCGKFHGFMPIMVKVVSEEDFQRWVNGAKEKFAAGDHLQLAAAQY